MSSRQLNETTTTPAGDNRAWPWRAFILPGTPQLFGGERFKGILYLLLAVATAAVAYASNRYVYLKLLWNFKSLEMPATFRHAFYMMKQDSLYTFIWIYLIIGFVSAVDFVRFGPSKQR